MIESLKVVQFIDNSLCRSCKFQVFQVCEFQFFCHVMYVFRYIIWKFLKNQLFGETNPKFIDCLSNWLLILCKDDSFVIKTFFVCCFNYDFFSENNRNFAAALGNYWLVIWINCRLKSFQICELKCFCHAISLCNWCLEGFLKIRF